MLLEPPVEELVDIVGNKYKLSNLVARRANDIQKKNLLDSTECKDNEISIAAKEVYEGKIVSTN
ncbi:MAG: DNA-directed RNA polymerase subunit omega [Clostridiales bacterium]|nr:DNA-directed RNA polymerase subunit omega [Clostridiales bacterium]